MTRTVAALAAAALIGMAALVGSTTAQAAPVTFSVQLSGAQEVPPVTTPGSGIASLTFDETTKKLGYTLTVIGLSPDVVTAAHIHRGARGVNGPIVFPLSTTGFTSVSGEITLSDADIADLKAGNFYINAHSKDNPGGFARGQIVLPAAAQPSPAATAAPSTGAAPATRLPSTGSGGFLDASAVAPIVGLVALLLSGTAALAVVRRRV